MKPARMIHGMCLLATLVITGGCVSEQYEIDGQSSLFGYEPAGRLVAESRESVHFQTPIIFQAVEDGYVVMYNNDVVMTSFKVSDGDLVTFKVVDHKGLIVINDKPLLITPAPGAEIHFMQFKLGDEGEWGECPT